MRTDLPNPKIDLPFSPPCTFSSFSYITHSHTPSLLLPILVSLLSGSSFHYFFFYTICYHHLSSSVLNIIQSIQSFPKVSQKILPILPRCHVFPSGSALTHSQRVRKCHPSFTFSSSLCFLPLSSEGQHNRGGHVTKGET